jgi:hypothetical protein
MTWHIFDREGATYLQEMLNVFVGIFMSFSTKLASLYHVDQCRLELKSNISYSNCRTSMNVVRGW